jgi:hypothetical protein
MYQQIPPQIIEPIGVATIFKKMRAILGFVEL